MSGMLFLLFPQSLFQFGAKEGKREGYYGEKNYLDMSFSFGQLKAPFVLSNGKTVMSQRIRVTMLGFQLQNLSELNNSRFLCWIPMKFYMVVGPHKTNLNVYFWHD